MTPVGDREPGSSSEKETTERRIVSVLFADLVGFTALAEARDSEDVQELQLRYFGVARDVIGRYGGKVEKYIGDAVMAVWGVPRALEDDAERAVRAALDLVDLVGAMELPQVGGMAGEDDRLHLRAAVMTGEASVATGSASGALISGDLVNAAARLQASAPPDHVRVGEVTFRAARDAIAFEPIGSPELRGKTVPVTAYRALRVIAGVRGARRPGLLEPPFAGRAGELRMLRELIHVAGQERRARLVSITGMAGIGKSRLIWELEKYIDGIVEDIYWHQGRCPSYGDGVTFWALGEMVRRRAGIAESDSPEATRERLATTLEEYVPEPDERRWIGLHLRTLLGLEIPEAVDREELFAAWRIFFERVAERGTVVLVFEDIQWADGGLLDFIESMLEWSRSRPILIITLARPELHDRRPGWGAGQRNFTALHLEPLDDSSMEALVEGFVPGLPSDLRRTIITSAAGVPLYAVELVRKLIDDGLLTLKDDGLIRVSGSVDRLALPDSLHALIAARLDALEAADRSVLQDASVLGQTFTLDALTAVSGAPTPGLEARLKALVRRELLGLDADPRSPERGQFGFLQGFVREVAYETLARRDRRVRHLAAARYFEARGDEELASILASHYLSAWELTPEGAEKEAAAAQARVALRAAGERALALHSPLQALATFERLVELAGDPGDRALALERAAEASRSAGAYAAADAQLRASIEVYRELADDAGRARATAVLGSNLLDLSRVEEAIEALTASLAIAPETPGSPERTAEMAALARAHIWHGDAQASLAWVERGLDAAENLRLLPELADLLITKAWVLANGGRSRESEVLLWGAHQLAMAHGLVDARLRAVNNLGAFLTFSDPAAAFAAVREGYDYALRLGHAEWAAQLGMMVAWHAILAGDRDRAHATLAELSRPNMIVMTQIGAHNVTAILALYEGRFGDAEVSLEAAWTLARASSKLEDRSLVLATVAEKRLLEGRGVGSGEAAREYIELTTDPEDRAIANLSVARAGMVLGDLPTVARALEDIEQGRGWGDHWDAELAVVRGGRAALSGEVEEAAAHFRQGTELLRDAGLIVPLLYARALCARLLGPGNAEGAAAAEEVLAVASRVGYPAFSGLIAAGVGSSATPT